MLYAPIPFLYFDVLTLRNEDQSMVMETFQARVIAASSSLPATNWIFLQLPLSPLIKESLINNSGIDTVILHFLSIRETKLGKHSRVVPISNHTHTL